MIISEDGVGEVPWCSEARLRLAFWDWVLNQSSRRWSRAVGVGLHLGHHTPNIKQIDNYYYHTVHIILLLSARRHFTNIYYVCFTVYYCKTLINTHRLKVITYGSVIWNLWAWSINRNIYPLNDSIFGCSSICFLIPFGHCSILWLCSIERVYLS